MASGAVDRWAPWALGGTLLAALVLRLIRLGDGLWFDEIVTYVRYASVSAGEAVTTYDFQNQHFLYTLAAKVSLALFGDGAWALRLPAALFGVAAVWAMYRFGTYAVGRVEGLLSAALLTFSYHHVWFSQNARGYIGLLFFTLLGSLLLLRALEDDSPRRWTVYAIAVALGVYTHLTMLFVAAAHFLLWLVVAVRNRDGPPSRRFAGLGFGFVLSGLLTLLLYSFVLPQMFGGTLSEGGAVEDWKNPLWAAVELIRGLQVGFTGLVVAIPALAVFGLGCVRLFRARPVVLWLFFGPVGICAAVALGAGHHLWPRLFFFGIGFSALIAVSGTLAAGELLGRWTPLGSNRGRAVGVILAVLMIAVSASTVPRAWAPKQDYAGALEYVERERRPADAVVTAGLASVPYRDYFHVDWQPVESRDGLAKVREGAKRTWLVYTLPFQLRAIHPGIMETIERDFAVAARFHGTLGGGDVVVCRVDDG